MKYFLTLAITCLLFINCVDYRIVQTPVSNVSIDQAKKLIAETKGLIILDVRTKNEVALGTLPNAKIIDIGNQDFKEQVSKLDKNKPILVYCKAGGRSSTACEIMEELGFKKLYNMEDGYDGWNAK